MFENLSLGQLRSMKDEEVHNSDDINQKKAVLLYHTQILTEMRRTQGRQNKTGLF